MIWYLLSNIPLWGYVSVSTLICGALLWFLGPSLIPMWLALPRTWKVAIAGLGAVIMAFVAGLTKAGRAAKERQKRLEAAANNKREEIHRDVEKRDSTTIDRDFDKWVR